MTRRLPDFITTFTQSTEPLGSPLIFRRWAAISIIAAALRQSVWVKTSNRLHPNMYNFLIAHPGVGKTRIINYAREICSRAEGVHLAPISMTFPALTDALATAKTELIRQPEGKITYNSLYITADELGAFIHKYDGDMMAGLTAFYDPTPYQQKRRTGGKDGQGIEFEIRSPQLNILSGSTPTNLIEFLPEGAWGQGFTSRLVLIFSDERIIVDDFADHGPDRMEDLVHDLQKITSLYGQFRVDPGYRDAVNEWRNLKEAPVPSHPRLIHYATRRRVHVYKLSMVASVNRGDSLILTEADFFTAIEWLHGAEIQMPDIFKAGTTNADAQAMQDIVHWIKITDITGRGVSEQAITKFGAERVPIHSIMRLIEILEQSGQIRELRRDPRTLVRYFAAAAPDLT